MQKASPEYKISMKKIGRNRGYIKATIGVINSEAQNNAEAKETDNSFTYYSNPYNPFHGFEVTQPYATQEQNLSRVDGSMYFLPPDNQGYTIYPNGIVTSELLGAVKITFQGVTGLDIKGLTIDFSNSYPTRFTVATNGVQRTYSNNSRHFVTEDVFDDTSEITITPVTMVDGQTRMRIFAFTCGIANVFTNAEVLNFNEKEYVSSISDSIPSTDMTLEVDNQNLYYSPDNPESTLAYFEVGQELRVQFGLDVEDDGNIEWLPETIAYLKDWKATETKATFTATDRFDYLTSTYYKGKYNSSGISLYDLAIDVLNDAGITDEREYWVDPYLENIIVNNPMPPVKHSEALQIIANAGRCVLFEDRNSKIHIQSSFIPDMTPSSNGAYLFSTVNNILDGKAKTSAAYCSNDFALLGDGNMYFSGSGNSANYGFVSQQISNSNGTFDTNPTITVDFESGYVAYGLGIDFRNIAPVEFEVRTYFNSELQETHNYSNPDVEFRTSDIFYLFDKMEIEFTKATPNSRVFIDNLLIGDVTDYFIDRNDETASATATRQNKVKTISVDKTIYLESAEGIKDLVSEEVALEPMNILSPTLQTTTKNGVTCTNNGDGTYTLNGTATADTVFVFKTNATINKGLKLLGCPSNGSDQTYQIIAYGTGGTIRDFGNGVVATADISAVTIQAIIRNSITCDNLIFKPMLVDSDLYPNVTYDDFQQGLTSQYNVYFSNPSYGLAVSTETSGITASIVESSNYFATIKFGNLPADGTNVKYTVQGYEYVANTQKYTKFHNENGDVIEWSNPLVADSEHAKEIEEWLASYFLGDVDYQISWRGDPRTDANDLFYLELKDREPTMIRTYQNELKFNGAWSGSMKARKAVLK